MKGIRGIAITMALMAGPLRGQVPQRAILTRDIATPADQAVYQEADRLEKGGQPARAVDILRPLLDKYPTDTRYLSLMERALGAVDRRREMLPYLAVAFGRDSLSIGALGVAVRVHAMLRQPDSARRYAERWYGIIKPSLVPFREWSIAETESGDNGGALAALLSGRRLIGSPTILAPDIATMHQTLGNYADAVGEWLLAIGVAPNYRTGALFTLSSVPLTERPRLQQQLEKIGTADANALRGLLLIEWGQVTEGATLVRSAVSKRADEAVHLLQDLLTELRGDDRAVSAARAQALELLATHQAGLGAAESRLSSARAYADAGMETDARRMLGMVATDRNAPASVSASASSTLLGVLLSERRAMDAETTLARIKPSLSEEEYQGHVRRLALLWAQLGKGDRAEALVAGDSTVNGIDILGRLRLFRGNLAGAAEAFRYAGPFDDARPHAVSRMNLLALLQAIGVDSSERFGAAFLALESGDSLGALHLFDSLVTSVRPEGAAELRLLAGRLALAMNDPARAMALFEAADVPAFAGAAAAARLERARFLASRGKRDEARALAEKLILDFPDSALLPDARRLRDETRGAVPTGRP